jgi:hypothetical protein
LPCDSHRSNYGLISKIIPAANLAPMLRPVKQNSMRKRSRTLERWKSPGVDRKEYGMESQADRRKPDERHFIKTGKLFTIK